MKKLLLLIYFSCAYFSAQTIELQNKELISYYEIINRAEIDIVNNNFTDANNLYKQAFAIIEQPQGKDIYNSLQAALKAGDENNAYNQYFTLKCMGYPFEKEYFSNHFKSKKLPKKQCNITIDQSYKKTLDSLHDIDQKFRNLSHGDYKKYQKEITQGDSIASVNLLRLIQKKGFPNEYNIGIEDKADLSLHKFYFIIWHQLATNNLSSQKVNFSEELNKALNVGKISPQSAAFLYDLNNGSASFSSMHFNILEFLTPNGSKELFYDQVQNKTAKSECCYVHEWFFPEKRSDVAIDTVTKLNKSRKQIGLSDLDSELVKLKFILNNNEYIFGNIGLKKEALENINQVEYVKKYLIKLP
ncbi:hypothetical protein [Chryseobacterium gregarium]|uniref:hypothetical protein n=1 Tax=Chryseobacterium gregarium TaxID=456299 RepID=UPI000402A889|nr:hypothetical protein [Chryseobacterium gregarium]